MEKIATALPGVFILEPKVFGDYRGSFMETYNAKAFEDMGIERAWVQDNQSFTQKKGTLRGIHFQTDPMAQCKVPRWPPVVRPMDRSPSASNWIAMAVPITASAARASC